MMVDLKTAVNAEDVRNVVTANLERAAKLNFAQVQQESHLEGMNRCVYHYISNLKSQ